jgi:hypothetical protein
MYPTALFLTLSGVLMTPRPRPCWSVDAWLELLLIGTGREAVRLDADLRAYVRSLGIAIDAMPTVRTHRHTHIERDPHRQCTEAHARERERDARTDTDKQTKTDTRT